MESGVGLWIDHKKASIVVVSKGRQEMRKVLSNVERHLSRSGDSPLKGRYESQMVPADDSRLRAFTGHINAFYETVISNLRDAESILILGPGEAKGELRKRLVRSNLGERIAGVETADKMTDRQLAARVRTYFAEAMPAERPR